MGNTNQVRTKDEHVFPQLRRKRVLRLGITLPYSEKGWLGLVGVYPGV
jgi:hypothetical protein